jgi:cation transport protein ChaC
MAMEFLDQARQDCLPTKLTTASELLADCASAHKSQAQSSALSKPSLRQTITPASEWMAWLDKVSWVFAYGSLIWNPEIPVLRGLQARVDGYHRRFCISSTRYRGTPEEPGVVLGLDRGGCCHGMVWELTPGQEALALEKLWAREMQNGAYLPRLLKLRLRCGAKVDALGFVAKREHPSYLRLSEVDLIKRLACCRGDRGSNMDYLAHTVGALKKHGIADHGLLYLLEQVQRGKG